MSDKSKFHCGIMNYVESVDPDLASLLRATCVDQILSCGHGRAGVTFLMPNDEYRKKIERLAYSSDIKEANDAADMLHALVIRDVLRTPNDWLSKRDDIPNSLLSPQHVEIENATPTEVVFKSGARAIPDPGFQDISRKSNLAVWKLVSGEIPVTTNRPSQLKYANQPKSKGDKSGAYEPGSELSANMRYKIALAVENSYMLQELSRRSGGVFVYRDTYLMYSLSIVHYLRVVKGDTALLYDCVLPLLSFDKMDFYFLVEPHKKGGQYLLSDAFIQEWWANKTLNFNAKEVMDDIMHLLDTGTGALIYSDRGRVLDKIASMKPALNDYINGRWRESTAKILQIYSVLETSNTIDGLGPIFPTGIARYYASEPGLKSLQDELRYLMFGAFKMLERGRNFEIGRFNELINMIGNYQHAFTLDEREKAMQLLNKHTIKYAIAPTEKLGEIKTFLNSTMFMFIPMTMHDARDLKQKHSVERPKPGKVVTYNMHGAIYKMHTRLMENYPGAVPNQGVIAALQSLDVTKLSPELRAHLREKLGVA